jgi:hypothetical protein
MEGFLFPQLFRPKLFDMNFSQKVLNGVFELPLMRTAKNALSMAGLAGVRSTPLGLASRKETDTYISP